MWLEITLYPDTAQAWGHMDLDDIKAWEADRAEREDAAVNWPPYDEAEVYDGPEPPSEAEMDAAWMQEVYELGLLGSGEPNDNSEVF